MFRYTQIKHSEIQHASLEMSVLIHMQKRQKKNLKSISFFKT